jgi:hypothetical protein
MEFVLFVQRHLELHHRPGNEQPWFIQQTGTSGVFHASGAFHAKDRWHHNSFLQQLIPAKLPTKLEGLRRNLSFIWRSPTAPRAPSSLSRCPPSVTGFLASALVGSPCQSPGLDFAMNELARHIAWRNLVRHPTDCMFAFGRSPPRLAATQLPSATGK